MLSCNPSSSCYSSLLLDSNDYLLCHLDRSEAQWRDPRIRRFLTLYDIRVRDYTNFVAFVYILSGDSKRLYIGVTTDIAARLQQHRDEVDPASFTARYNIKRLVYLERFGDIREAIAREKQLKRWSRVKKVQLIVRENPDWKDLSLEWGTPIVWDGTLRPPETFS